MAPTTLIGQKTSTSPFGRTREKGGNPVKISEMLSTQDGPSYIERVMLSDYANVLKAKKAIKKAFTYQMEGRGFSLVEVLSSCPTNWGMTPADATDFIKNELAKAYPLGVFKDIAAGQGGAK